MSAGGFLSLFVLLTNKQEVSEAEKRREGRKKDCMVGGILGGCYHLWLDRGMDQILGLEVVGRAHGKTLG